MHYKKKKIYTQSKKKTPYVEGKSTLHAAT